MTATEPHPFRHDQLNQAWCAPSHFNLPFTTTLLELKGVDTITALFINTVAKRKTIMTDSFSFDSKPPYIVQKSPATPTKPATASTDQQEFNVVTPQKNGRQLSFDAQSTHISVPRIHSCLTHVKPPQPMGNLTAIQNQKTLAYFARKNSEYMHKDSRNFPISIGHDLTPYEHQCMEWLAEYKISKRNRLIQERENTARLRQQRRHAARKQQLDFRWKYSRKHFFYPNPWNTAWADHYATLHPTDVDPWLPEREKKKNCPDTGIPKLCWPHYILSHYIALHDTSRWNAISHRELHCKSHFDIIKFF